MQKELTFEESIQQVMHTLPPPIRNYLGRGEYTLVAKNLMAEYGLHIDQATILEREIMLLLMGIESPEEFTQTLVTEARLDQQIISGIVQEINVQIFMPLRQEMTRGAGGGQPPPANPVMPIARTQSVAPATAPRIVPATPAPAPRPSLKAAEDTVQPVNAPVPNYDAGAVQAMGVVAPPPQSPKYFHLENKLPAPKQSAPRPPAPSSNPPVSSIAPLPPRTVLPRTPLGEVLAAVTKASVPTPLKETPREEVPTPPAPPKTVPPPPNLPGAMPPPAIVPEVLPAPAIPPIEPPPAPPPPPQPRPSAPSVPYSADPYREPIE